MISTIYISHDGMTDPLGSSQVIPYLSGLSDEYRIFLVSFEKRSRIAFRPTIKKNLESIGIEWIALEYRNSPPVISTILDIRKAAGIVSKLIIDHNVKIIHCRSYIGALIAFLADSNFSCNHIFDMRGFWPDERIDGKIWSLNNPIHRLVYNYFKNFEIKHIKRANQIVVLTHAAKNHLNSIYFTKKDIQVIPCAADLEHFKFSGDEIRLTTREKLGISKNFALCYLGSIGSWYLLEEMLDFFVAFQKLQKDAKFVFFTPDNKNDILEAAAKKNIAADSLYIREARRNELPQLLSAMDAGIFFIKPCFSKMASSPTKHGELLGVGLEVVCNSNVGDIEQIHRESDAGVLVSDFDSVSMDIAAQALIAKVRVSDRSKNREVAKKWYSLEKGVDTYKRIYSSLLKS